MGRSKNKKESQDAAESGEAQKVKDMLSTMAKTVK